MSTKSTRTPSRRTSGAAGRASSRRRDRVRRSDRRPRTIEASAAWIAAIPDASATPASPPCELGDRPRRARSSVGFVDAAVGIAGAAVGGDRAELVGVGRGEGRRSGRSGRTGRRLVELRRAGAARMARVEKPRRRPARGRGAGGSLTGRPMLHRSRAAPAARRPAIPVTRSLPARFEAYIAPSALMISSSAVRPSSG